MAVGQAYVLLELVVDAVATLCGLQINVGIVLALPDGLPKHVALIVAQVDAVDVLAGVFTLHVIDLGMGENREKKQKI